MGLAGFMLYAEENELNLYKEKIINFETYSFNELRTACKDRGIKTVQNPSQQEMVELLKATNKQAVEDYMQRLKEFGKHERATQVKKEYDYLFKKAKKEETKLEKETKEWLNVRHS